MYLNKWAKILFATLLVMFSSAIRAQLKITGTVTDLETKMPLVNVSVSDADNNIKTVTDELGNFKISLPEGSKMLSFSKEGYKKIVENLSSAKEQRINVSIKDRTTVVEEVVIRSQKRKYRNKDNPAVELIRKVIQNKEKNRFNSYESLSFEEYEKIQFSLSNKYEKLSTNKLVKKYPFLQSAAIYS